MSSPGSEVGEVWKVVDCHEWLVTPVSCVWIVAFDVSSSHVVVSEYEHEQRDVDWLDWPTFERMMWNWWKRSGNCRNTMVKEEGWRVLHWLGGDAWSRVPKKWRWPASHSLSERSQSIWAWKGGLDVAVVNQRCQKNHPKLLEMMSWRLWVTACFVLICMVCIKRRE